MPLAAQSKNPADELNDRGLAASARGDFVQAEQLLGESVRQWQAMGPRYNGHTAIALMNLSEALCGQGKWSDGAKILAQSLEMSRAALGATNSHTVSAMNFLASADLVLGDVDQAVLLYTEALGIERQHYPGSTQ